MFWRTLGRVKVSMRKAPSTAKMVLPCFLRRVFTSGVLREKVRTARIREGCVGAKGGWGSGRIVPPPAPPENIAKRTLPSVRARLAIYY